MCKKRGWRVQGMVGFWTGLPTPFKQFSRNFFWGTIVSVFWFYIGYKLTDSFWGATILTNIVTYFLGRYLVFKEGKC